ncbi:MAG TPA: DUF1501 domain-containing protein [Verrucomicrobiales bacterium]|nr:DUF1501 domain-containing protein [Verrucomicrobiales bacterium]HIL69771.1 DUF1501 domain-containing protein [Verrucomicrobiota bacterium]
MISEAEIQRTLNRRAFLSRASTGLGTLALGSLLGRTLPIAGRASSDSGSTGEPWRGVVQPPHFPVKAKRVIFLVMAGGASHLETFDHKPKLAEMDGKPMPDSFTKGKPIAQLQGQTLKCLGPQHPFRKYGQSGQEICGLFPHLGGVADDLCIVRSLYTQQINHDPAHTFMNTGTSISGRPSMGSWWLYGLGTENENLPGFVVLTSVGKGGQSQPIAARQWHSGFLPGNFQGVQFQSAGDPVLYVGRPPGVNERRQREVVDSVNQLNSIFNEAVDDPEIATRINQYELAFRMQASVPELMDVSDETQATRQMYGSSGADGSFASNCLLARRMAERGVRFIQLYHRAWDHHGGIKKSMEITAKEVDQPVAALIRDLKQRGMFEDTLVVWAGEFGRTPMAQGSGRDHHIQGYSMWMAGGGIQGGISYGETDELGYNAVVNRVSVHDFHATMLQLCGISHKQMTFPFQGRDFRLTDVHGEILKPLLA